MAKAAAAAVNDNLALWERLFSTDPSKTTTFKKSGGFSGTAIKPYWIVMRATEEFGPVGKGWGWDEVEHHQLIHTDGRGMWFSKVVVWYVLDGKRYDTGPQWGGTELIAQRKSGDFFLDDEAPKKAVTDGLTKCLSYLGLAGDVHMGKFDDSKYVEEQKRREARETAAVATPSAPAVEWRDRIVGLATACKTSDELKVLWTGEVGRFKEFGKAADTKATALYVKAQVERRAAELKATADQASQKDDNAPAPGEGNAPEDESDVDETRAAAAE